MHPLQLARAEATAATARAEAKGRESAAHLEAETARLASEHTSGFQIKMLDAIRNGAVPRTEAFRQLLLTGRMEHPWMDTSSYGDFWKAHSGSSDDPEQAVRDFQLARAAPPAGASGGEEAPPPPPTIEPGRTFAGELSQGHLRNAAGMAKEAIGRSLSPLFGPTQAQVFEQSVPITHPDGSVTYEFKPAGNEFDKRGLIPGLIAGGSAMMDLPTAINLRQQGKGSTLTDSCGDLMGFLPFLLAWRSKVRGRRFFAPVCLRPN